jgi:hypothetical protein
MRYDWLLVVTLGACGLMDHDGKPSGHDDSGGAPHDPAVTAGRSSDSEPGAAGANPAMRSAGGAAGSMDTMDSDGGTDAGGADQTDQGPATDPNAALCTEYLSFWRLRSEQESSSESGACYQCLGNNPACFSAHDTITEGQHACILRHCLCDPVREDCVTFDYPADECSCYAGCLPVPPNPAWQNWVRYMSCEVERCADACR